MNILILSCGTRNKIVQYFKNELKGIGQVIATDCSELAPALYDADKYFVVPKINDVRYLDVILTICRENDVDAVISLIDPELSLLAKNKQKFIDIGVNLINSEFDVVELCFDKYETYKFLINNGFKTIRSYINKEEFYRAIESGIISYPVFVKPVRGSASLNINLVNTNTEIELLFDQFDNLMIQEFMQGTEFGADCYIDMISNEIVTIFVKEKIKMRAGETDKSLSIKDDRLFEILKKLIKRIGLKGVIDVDVFKVGNEYYISEVNPRFGGGYPHGYESGVNIPKMIIRNISGKENEIIIGDYDEGIYMMKYNEVMIKKSL